MSTFRATPEDLAGVIGERQRAVLKRSLPFPAGAAIAGALLALVDSRLAAFAFGGAAAWAYDVFHEVRAVGPTFLWQCAWMLEELSISVELEGLRLSNARGSSFMRWDAGITIQPRADYFVVREESDELAVLPKKYLSEAELLSLNAHAPSH